MGPGHVHRIQSVIHGEDEFAPLLGIDQGREVLLAADVERALWKVVVLPPAPIRERLHIAIAFNGVVRRRKWTVAGWVVIGAAVEPHLLLSDGIDGTQVIVVVR